MTSRVVDITGTGIHSARPAAPMAGFLYSCTTHNKLEKYDGSSWSDWATVGGSSGAVLLGDYDAKGDLLVGSANDAYDNLGVGSDGQVLTADSTQTLGVKWAAAAGGGPTISDRRWVRGSTANAQDDEFNDASLAVAWTRVDVSGGTGRAVWTEDADDLSLALTGGDAAAEMHALVKSYALAVGESIQTAISWSGYSQNYPLAGLVVGNGATYGAGLQEVLAFFTVLADAATAEWSGYNTRTAFTDNTMLWSGVVHLRLKRSATNTYQHFISPDGVSWLKLGGDRTQTMTPSHVGLFGGTYGGSLPFAFSFDYFRVV